MSLQHVKSEEHRRCSSLLHHSSFEVMLVQSAEEGRLMELYLEVQMSLQQKRTQKLVLPQLQLNLSLLHPWKRARTAVSLEILLPILKATEGI